jgi:hypothetical protein
LPRPNFFFILCVDGWAFRGYGSLTNIGVVIIQAGAVIVKTVKFCGCLYRN